MSCPCPTEFDAAPRLNRAVVATVIALIVALPATLGLITALRV